MFNRRLTSDMPRRIDLKRLATRFAEASPHWPKLRDMA